MRRSTRRVTVGLVVLASVAAACTSDDASTPATTSTIPVPITVPRLSDGVLRIGVLLPQSGPGGEFGRPLAEAVDRAVGVVNDEGGVLGRPVQVVVADEGSDATVAASAMDALVQDEGVDVVIGPASSRVALAVLDRAVSAGVLVCSPSATAISLSRFPDQNLFIRTIPSDALQAHAMARVIDQTGLGSVAITYPDDLYGRNFAAALRVALANVGITVVADVSYDPIAEDHDQEIADLLAAQPPVVALIGDSTVGARMLGHLVDRAGIGMPVTVTSDALRRPVPATIVSDLQPFQLARLKGVSPTVLPQSTALLEMLDLSAGDPAGAFAAQAVDCVNLVALAAIQAASDDPMSISGALSTVSRGGSSCREFTTCVELLGQGRNIDYDGYEGEIRLDTNGDMAVGRFERFGFDSSGNDVTELRFEVGVTG